MKKILLIFLSLIFSQVFSQSKFSLGFKDGYKVGYCYGQNVDCISPTPPVTPICDVGESSDSYMDGYNRGLITGISANNSLNKTETFDKSLGVYARSTYIPENIVFTPDFNFYKKTLDQVHSDYNKKIEDAKNTQDKLFLEEVNENLKEWASPENVKIRKEYIRFIKQYYTELENYPSSIPDGIYKVTLIIEPSFFEEGQAWVENNKVVLLKTVNEKTGKDSYMGSIKKWPGAIDKDYGVMGITESHSILKGVSQIRSKVFVNGSPISGGDSYKIYFIDYIERYNEAQDCIKNIKKEYSLKKNYDSIEDGWNIVYASNGVDFCDIRKVFVENGKVTKYKTGQETIQNITSGGSITNNKATISYDVTRSDDTVKKHIIEIYFL